MSDGDNPWLTRRPRPARVAAPWERALSRPDDGRRTREGRDEITTRIPKVSVSELPDLSMLAPRCEGPGDASAQPRAAHKHKRRLIGLAGRSAVALTAVVALALTGCAWQWNSSKNESLNIIAALDPNSRDVVNPSAQFGDENFLIVGIDSRAGANGEIGAGTVADAAGARSDTVMLVNIPASRKRVVVVSIPRDLAITPTRCDSWNNDTAAYGQDQVYTETKLNSAYAVGGPKCLVKVVQRMSGLSINRFMAIDFVGFAKIVDALGGVEVCSPTALQDAELGTVLEHAGRQTLDGRAALNYVRARQVSTEGNGDYGRIKRQQLFLSSLLRSLISRATFFSPGRLDGVVTMFIDDTYVDNVTTRDLVELGRSLQGVAAGRVTFLTVPTGQTDSEGNEPLRVRDNRAIFDAIINDDPLPEENNDNATTAAVTPDLVNAVTTEPRDVTVHVSNSTSESGLAATAADELQQHGFNVLSPDDYPSSLTSTTVFFSPGNEPAAATVASSFADPRMERVSGMGDVVQVVLGPDFSTVDAPPPSGAAVHLHVNHAATDTPMPLPTDLRVTNGADTSCR
jgi:LCP family protein required for cell wall assembly